jgi:hypothetical protein
MIQRNKLSGYPAYRNLLPEIVFYDGGGGLVDIFGFGEVTDCFGQGWDVFGYVDYFAVTVIGEQVGRAVESCCNYRLVRSKGFENETA